MKRIKLTSLIIEYLSEQPETGMGYQVVNIKLKNGQVLKDLLVFNSTYLEINESQEFNISDIAQISIKNSGNENNIN